MTSDSLDSHWIWLKLQKVFSDHLHSEAKRHWGKLQHWKTPYSHTVALPSRNQQYMFILVVVVVATAGI